MRIKITNTALTVTPTEPLAAKPAQIFIKPKRPSLHKPTNVVKEWYDRYVERMPPNSPLADYYKKMSLFHQRSKPTE